jgi:hypothetical protein
MSAPENRTDAQSAGSSSHRDFTNTQPEAPEDGEGQIFPEAYARSSLHNEPVAGAGSPPSTDHPAPANSTSERLQSTNSIS